ncbi:hypothetical protein ACFCXA_21820 [Streptomyces virginiae]|uniref:hypothetical protein n=1 Tax=Streptomyces virginiae TaxID=1961 RepID=UPI0035E10F86
MPLPQPQLPSSHRARRKSRHAVAAASAAGRRAVRRPSLLPRDGRLSPGVLCAVGAAVVAVTVAARAGAFTQLWAFLDFGAGVLSLVSLTATVLWGLAATDRVVLGSGHRLLAQGAHRGLAVSGLGFLALHIWVKVAGQRTTATSALVPFTDDTRPVLVGLGSLAGYLFIAVAISGAVRSVFNTRRGSAWWRALHFGAYPAWGASLVHGLKSGRAADTWVTVAYGLCLLGIVGVLVFRVRTRVLDAASLPPVPQPVAQTPIKGGVPRQRRSSRPAAAAVTANSAQPPRPDQPPRFDRPPQLDQPPRTAVYAPSRAGRAGSAADAETLISRDQWL